MAEAKEAISEDEFQTWALYRRLRGSFNSGIRLEIEFAQLRQLLMAQNGSHKTIPALEDLMMHAKQLPEEDEPKPNADKVVPFAAAMAILGFRG